MRKKDIINIIGEFPDRSIRWLLETPDNLRGLLLIVAKHLAKRFDYTSVEIVNRTFILDDLQKREADILFKVPLLSEEKNKPSKEVIIYILIENQSTIDPMMPYRVLNYMMQIWNMEMKEWKSNNIPFHSKLFRPILPIVFYTGSQSWRSRLEMKELIEIPTDLEMIVPNFKIFFLNLKEIKSEQLICEDNPFGWILRVMQSEEYPTDEFKKELDLAVKRLEQMPPEELTNWQKLMYFLIMYIHNRRNPEERSELINIIDNNIKERKRHEEVEKMGRTIAQALIEEGREKGLKEGLKEGVKEGLKEAIIETLELKFEVVPKDLANAINNIMKIDILRELQRQAVKCESIEEFEEKIKAIK